MVPKPSLFIAALVFYVFYPIPALIGTCKFCDVAAKLLALRSL